MGEISLQQIAERIEAANKVTEELIVRQEKLKVQNMLSGKADAGVTQVSEQDKIKQGMKNYFKGTALERAVQ